nr:unnamed protein product [Spirometra erinaceieuropaei]
MPPATATIATGEQIPDASSPLLSITTSFAAITALATTTTKTTAPPTPNTGKDTPDAPSTTNLNTITITTTTPTTSTGTSPTCPHCVRALTQWPALAATESDSISMPPDTCGGESENAEDVAQILYRCELIQSQVAVSAPTMPWGTRWT